MNVNKTFRRCPGRLLNVLYTFHLYPVFRWLPIYFHIQFVNGNIQTNTIPFFLHFTLCNIITHRLKLDTAEKERTKNVGENIIMLLKRI